MVSFCLELKTFWLHVSNCEVPVHQFRSINISMPDLTRVHVFLRETLIMFCIVNKDLMVIGDTRKFLVSDIRRISD